MIDADLVSWRANYIDGSYDREMDGKSYIAINRVILSSFSLIDPAGAKLFTTHIPDAMHGNQFFYRRRTTMTGGNRSVIFLLGWINGLDSIIYAVDTDTKSYSMSNIFRSNDPVFHAPEPMPGEDWLRNHLNSIIVL